MVASIGVLVFLLVLGVGFYLLYGSPGREPRVPMEREAAVVLEPLTPPAQPVVPEAGVELLPPKHSAGLLRQVRDSDIELEIRSGRVVNAIRLYREQTGADMQEARSAVEAWRNRLTAS